MHGAKFTRDPLRGSINNEPSVEITKLQQGQKS
jgi:hypothetical protein